MRSHIDSQPFSRISLTLIAALSMICSVHAQQWIPNSGANTLTASSGTLVGIGTSSPNASLSINGAAVLGGGSAAAGSSNWLPYWDGNDYIQLTGNSTFYVQMQSGASFPTIFAIAQGNGGQVSIGTSHVGQCPGATSPCRLTVPGAIGAWELVISNAITADYVFDPNYHLRPLTEVGAYVKENHHLPDIPSAAEMMQNGVNVSEFQAKLLAKIEELTLHLIRADEKIRGLEQKLASQEPLQP